MSDEQRRSAGGAAFPRSGSGDVGGWQEGMTLRDYFAAQAMIGNVSSPDLMTVICRHAVDGVSVWDMVATASYAMADAMLAARKSGAK